MVLACRPARPSPPMPPTCSRPGIWRSIRTAIIAAATPPTWRSGSRRVRAASASTRPALGYGLAREAEELWSTTNGGEYRAAGVGGVITGLRADLAILDDPVKSRQEADSEVIQQNGLGLVLGRLLTRLKPGARASADHDPLGRGRPRRRAGGGRGRRPWRIVRLPMRRRGRRPAGAGTRRVPVGRLVYAKLQADFANQAGRARLVGALSAERPRRRRATSSARRGCGRRRPCRRARRCGSMAPATTR
jgi:hypothetical protein